MNRTKSFIFSAIIALATTLTLSCSGDDGNDDNGNSSSSGTTQGGGSSSSSSSNGGVSSSDANTSGVFVDPRDGQEYGFETYRNEKIWMSGNLNYSRNNTIGYCYGVDINGENAHRDSTTCDDGYGRVYEWSVAMDDNAPQGLCPDGWHIPTVDEWSSFRLSVEDASTVSDVFCASMKSGNYNTNPDYPIDWKERGERGFYWTSSFNYFAHTGCSTNAFGASIDRRTQGEDYFFIRCVADSD